MVASCQKSAQGAAKQRPELEDSLGEKSICCASIRLGSSLQRHVKAGCAHPCLQPLHFGGVEAGGSLGLTKVSLFPNLVKTLPVKNKVGSDKAGPLMASLPSQYLNRQHLNKILGMGDDKGYGETVALLGTEQVLAMTGVYVMCNDKETCSLILNCRH